MKVSKRIFSAFVCLAIVCADAFATPSYKCHNREYARRHADECRPESIWGRKTTWATIGGVAAVGGAAIAFFASDNGDGASSTSSTPTPIQMPIENNIPTLSTYNMVGGDVTGAQLAGVINTRQYSKNYYQYQDIRLGYALARGYTGAGTNIAVLDAPGAHGETVMDVIRTTIAPNANTKFYQVAYSDDDFFSYREIGNFIAAAKNTNVFNASWSVPMRARDIYSRAQIAAATDHKFINQIVTTATTQDAIFVFAAGNDYDHNDSSALSAMPLVIPELNGHFVNVVAWDSATGAIADFSNACGPTMNYCITAPGTNINTETTADANGTSFAAPIVSAAIAVIREAFPYMTATQVSALLFETARDLGTAGVDEIYGHGLLDMERATRPVGAALVPIDENNVVPLRAAHISGAMAQNIKSANLKMAFVDSYGRAFQTDLSKNISIRNPGRAFSRLTGGDDMSFAFGNFEMGFSNSDLGLGDGFLGTKTNKSMVGFIGARHAFNIGTAQINAHARIGRATARANDNSIVESFRDITVANISATATFGDLKFGFGIPDTIVGGTMNLRMPVARAANGNIVYGNASVDMTTRPAFEYSASYKFMSAGFINNPYGTDEFYLMARGKINF